MQTASLAEACDDMCQSGRTGIVVLDEKSTVQGVLTENDVLHAFAEGTSWDVSVSSWLRGGEARLPGFLVPMLTLNATATLEEAALRMTTENQGDYSCHHLLVKHSGSTQKVHLLSALDIACGMIDAAKTAQSKANGHRECTATVRAANLPVAQAMKPYSRVPYCLPTDTMAEAAQIMLSAHQNCALVVAKSTGQPEVEQENVNEQQVSGSGADRSEPSRTWQRRHSSEHFEGNVFAGIVTPADALLAFFERIPSASRTVGDWCRVVSDDSCESERLVSSNACLADAAAAMAKSGVHHVLVVKPETSEVVGVISALDIVRAISENFQQWRRSQSFHS